jgi:hypothetical protein
LLLRRMRRFAGDDQRAAQTVYGPLGKGPTWAGSEFNTTTRVFKTVCGASVDVRPSSLTAAGVRPVEQVTAKDSHVADLPSSPI